jgi:excisionase family DNA binding protein
MTATNPNERLMRFLQASPEQQSAIDRILEGKPEAEAKPRTGPLLLGMGPAAKYLGVSRGTLYRMIQAGKLKRVEILPGSSRVRREDVEAIVDGKERAQ